MRFSCRTERPRRAGQSLVEFALIAPLFFSLLFIIVELGIVFSVYIGLTNTAREAARAAAIYRYPATEDLNNQAFTTARCTIDNARATVINQTVDATRNPIIGDASAIARTITYPQACNVASGTSIYRYGENVTVQLTYTHGLFFNLIGSQLPITATSEMTLEPGGL